MKTQKEIEDKLMILSTQGDDSENPSQKQIQSQANILAWVLDKEEVYEID